MENYKKRQPNFSVSEEELLLNLVRKYADILENKKTDSTTNNLKREVWGRLAEEFNSISVDAYRNWDLRTCNLGTGVVPYKEEDFTDKEKNVLDMMGSQATEWTSEYDSDTGKNLAEEQEEEVDSSNWYRYKPNDLRKKINSPLRTRRRVQLRDKLSQWVCCKKQFVHEQNRFLTEEHRIKLRHMEEKHQQYVRHQEVEHNLRIKHMEELHQAQLEAIQSKNKHSSS